MFYASGENMSFLQLYFVERSGPLYIIIKEKWPDLVINFFFLPYTPDLSPFTIGEVKHTEMLMDIISWNKLSK